MVNCLVLLALSLAPLSTLALPRPAPAPAPAAAATPDDDVAIEYSPEAIVIAYGGLHNDTLHSGASSCSYFEYPVILPATATAAPATPAAAAAAVGGVQAAAHPPISSPSSASPLPTLPSPSPLPSLAPPRRAYAAYTLLAAHGWSTDCDALTRSITRSCAANSSLPQTPQGTGVDGNDVVCDVIGGADAASRRVLINVHVPGAAASECGAPAILELSPDARASKRAPPVCNSPMPTTTTAVMATAAAATTR